MIMTTEEFSIIINRLSRDNKTGIMETLTKYCEEHFIEPMEIKNLISGPMKDRLREEFEEIHMLKPTPKFDI